MLASQRRLSVNIAPDESNDVQQPVKLSVTMESYKEFVAVYAFKNEADPKLELAVSDVIEVPHPSSQTSPEIPGWVKGRNRRTGIEGYFPGKKVQLLILKCKLVINNLPAFVLKGNYLSVCDRKSEITSTTPQLAKKSQGSPIKSQLLHKFEDYNDSGYGGSPLPHGLFTNLI